MSSILITAGRVIDPASCRDEVADVALMDGFVVRIARPGDRIDPAGFDRVIDASGCIVAPGLIDPHVHLREPGHEHKETIASGTRAAVAGGFTSVCCMPNTQPAIDSPEIVRAVIHRAMESASCRVFPSAAATAARRGEAITEIELLAAAGAVAITDDGDCIASAAMMARVLAMCAHTSLPFLQHCQEPTLTRGAQMHAGSVSTRLGLAGWPRVAEEIIIERDVRLNASIGAHYHAQHLSSAGSVEIIRAARARGERVTGEATPHHLLLTHDACAGDDGHTPNPLAKVNPPLRESTDARAIAQGVADGTITILGTDHAPHSEHEKSQPFELAPMGLVGLESAVPLYAEALVHSGAIGWPKLIELLTINPARLLGLDASRPGSPSLGELREDAPADVTIIDPEHAWTLTPDALAGQSRNTPFLGRSFRGRAVCTIVAGHVVHELARQTS